MGDHVLIPLVDAEEETLPVAAVARRLGVAPATLRTWDRRYGIGPRGHTTGRHRRYGPEDVARLETMQHALLRGAGPAEAASYALRTSAPAYEDVDVVAPREPLLREVSTRSAQVLGLSRAAGYAWLRRYGITPAGPELPQERLVALWRAGLVAAHLAAELGLPPDAVR